MAIGSPMLAGLVDTAPTYLPAHPTVISRDEGDRMIAHAQAAGRLCAVGTDSRQTVATAVTDLLGQNYGAAPATLLTRAGRADAVTCTQALIVGVDLQVVQIATGPDRLDTVAHTDLVAVLGT